MRQPTIDGIPQPAARVRQGRRGPHPKPAEEMPVRRIKVAAYRDTEKDLAVLRAAAEGVADAALIRQLIADKAEQLRKAGIKPAADPQEPLLN